MVFKRIILAFFVGMFFISCQSEKNATMDYSTVKQVDVEKYTGKWYEIARFPHRFEKDLVGVTATYTLLDNGKIKVVNAGYKDSLNGKFKSTKAKAKIPDKSKPGKLKVYFIPFFGADYNIMELDTTNYQWAMVGSSSPNYLWFLSRSKKMDDKTFEYLKQKAKQRGYNLDKLQKVPQ